MADKEIEEHQDEVFIYTDDTERHLVVVEKNGNIFELEAKNYFGKITEKRKEKMKSIGVFSVYD